MSRSYEATYVYRHWPTRDLDFALQEQREAAPGVSYIDGRELDAELLRCQVTADEFEQMIRDFTKRVENLRTRVVLIEAHKRQLAEVRAARQAAPDAPEGL